MTKLWEKLERIGNLIHPRDDQITSAVTEYARRPQGSAGIVDLVSFEVMRELGISEAFTNDAHFRAEGFVTLIST